MEVFTIEACEEVLVVRRILVRSHEADELMLCACLDENMRREDGVGEPLCVSKREGRRGVQSFCTTPFPAGCRLCVVLVPGMHCDSP